jgi:hypothetical protein
MQYPYCGCTPSVNRREDGKTRAAPHRAWNRARSPGSADSGGDTVYSTLPRLCHHHTTDDTNHINQAGRTCSASVVCITVLCSSPLSSHHVIAWASRFDVHHLALPASPASHQTPKAYPDFTQLFNRDPAHFSGVQCFVLPISSILVQKHTTRVLFEAQPARAINNADTKLLYQVTCLQANMTRRRRGPLHRSQLR